MSLVNRLKRIRDKVTGNIVSRTIYVQTYEGETDWQAYTRHCLSNNVLPDDEIIYIKIKRES